MRSSGWFRSWFNFGGINREVTLRRLGASEIDAPARAHPAGRRRRLELVGAAIQEDAAGQGDAMTTGEMDAAIARLQRIGANASGVDYQANLLVRHIRAYKSDPRLSGMIVWSLQDFALRPNFLGGSVRSLVPDIVLQRGINGKGLFTYEGRPKPAAGVVKRLFAGG